MGGGGGKEGIPLPGRGGATWAFKPEAKGQSKLQARRTGMRPGGSVH